MGSAFPGPTPPYTNPPIHPEYYKPKMFFISAITLGFTTIVTTTVNMDYVIGQLVRLIIPFSFGTRQLNEQEGYVISIPNPNQVEIEIDSSKMDPFILSLATTQAQILAIGDINTGAINQFAPRHTHPYIPGSFRDISPL